MVPSPFSLLSYFEMCFPLFAKSPHLLLPFFILLAGLLQDARAVSMEKAASSRENDNRVSITLIPEVAHSADADTIWIGVQMDIEEGWHVYWQNPGDSGLPTTIRWEDHPFFHPGSIHWPRPNRFDEDGVTTYGYSEHVTLLVPVITSAESVNNIESRVKHQLEQDKIPSLNADINWLVCKDICIRESTSKSLDISVDGSFPDFSEKLLPKIQSAREQLPAPSDVWEANATFDGNTFRVTLFSESDKAVRPDAEDLYFFPYYGGIIEHTAPQEITWSNDRLTISIKASRYLNARPEELSGVLVAGKSWIKNADLRFLEIHFPVSPADDNQ